MLRLLTALLFLPVLTGGLSAQTAPRYVDMVYVYNAPAYQGKLIRYVYGGEIVLQLPNGEDKVFTWNEVRRVGFRFDRDAPLPLAVDRPAEPFVVPQPAEMDRPDRRLLHQVSAALAFGASAAITGGFRTRLGLGGQFSYHLVRPAGRWRGGLGLDLAVLDQPRDEYAVALTGQISGVLNPAGRARPFLRLEAGPALPFGTGTDGEAIIDRNIPLLVHPAAGVEFSPANGAWGDLLVDLGYRFLNTRLTLEDESFNVVERTIRYRRLVLRAALRF